LSGARSNWMHGWPVATPLRQWLRIKNDQAILLERS
jgi:hypothetical protein